MDKPAIKANTLLWRAITCSLESYMDLTDRLCAVATDQTGTFNFKSLWEFVRLLKVKKFFLWNEFRDIVHVKDSRVILMQR
ncbi:hypothetical protein [Paenibacillus sp. FSL M7-1046]|uniref:Uncharacterized protein n=1 Tax=Paenibacillus borealis TaxID=160799 RepID=A0ABX3GST6_PAEBO|nr:hypothetical protein BSK56_32195 [Paenibacillus borealis]